MVTTMTPTEMADWLEEKAVVFGWYIGDERTFAAIVAYLQSQPTDAQKIEALKLASDAAHYGTGVADEMFACQREPWRYSYQRYEPSAGMAQEAAELAHQAMRLLGLPEA
jgi:hypothetical protein